MKEQQHRDEKIYDLLVTMETVYSFVNAIEDIPEKIQILREIITSILRQTFECVIFIWEFAGHGFSGK